MSYKNKTKRSRHDLVSHQSSSSIEKLDGNFCGAFQEHYEYLMDKGLIETCQFSGAQTTFQSDYENMSGNVSFKEFLHQYNELKRWLEQMSSINFSGQGLSGYCEKYTNQIFYEEILKRSPRRELLNEYACHLVKYHPHLKKEVLYKLKYLNNQWKSIEFSIISKQLYNQDITKDLEEDLKNFEIWLVRVEARVENLAMDPDWCFEEIEKHLADHKCLQSDIEAKARIINSVLKLSNKLKQQTYIDCNEFNETGLYLQNRWHCVWLMSLEWQCRLEQQLARIKKADLELVDKHTLDTKSSKYRHKYEAYQKILTRLNQSSDNLTKAKKNRTYPNQTASYSSIEKSLIRKSSEDLDTSDSSDSSDHKQKQLCEFNIEASFNFFRIKSHSQNSLSATSANKGHSRVCKNNQNRQACFLDKEIKNLYLNERSIASFKEHTEFASRDDVIPFDESEYEKIVSTASQEHLERIVSTPKKHKPHTLYSKSLSSLSSNTMMNNNIENQTLILSDTNLLLNTSIQTSENSSSGLSRYSMIGNDLSNFKIDNEFPKESSIIKMKTSRTESEINTKLHKSNRLQKYMTTRHSRQNHHKNNSFPALTNDLSHYYSLTDVKYYNIDDNGEENILSASSISTSSLSSSESYTSSKRSYSEQSFEEESFSFKKFNPSYPRLQKSITLPNANFDLASFNNEIEIDKKNANSIDKTDNLTKQKPGVKNMNKSLSEYCMRSLASSKHDQQQSKRRRRFLNATSQHSDNLKNKNGNEADDEENPSAKFDELETSKNSKPESVKEMKLPVKMINTSERITVSPPSDELTSTLNTDVSWDGYTDSPYYSNSATAEDLCVNKKAQPILPWDELFFELDPLEDMTNNAPQNKKLRSRRSVHNVSVKTEQVSEDERSKNVINQHHFHYYHHHHHHYTNLQTQHQSFKLPNSRAVSYDLNKLTETNLKHKHQHRNRSQDSTTSSENTSSTSGRFSYLSSSNSPNDITSNFENDFALLTVNTSLDNCMINREKLFNNLSKFNSTDMEDLVHIINDSLSQWSCAYNIFIKLKSTVFKSMHQGSEFLIEYSSSLLTSTQHYESTCNNQSIVNKLKKYNEILAACQTNINCLASIKNSILENRALERKKLESSTSTSAADFDIKNIDYYLPKLDETIIKWKMLDAIVCEENRYCSNLHNFIGDIKTIQSRIVNVGYVFKQMTSFESLGELEKKLDDLKDSDIALNKISSEITEKRRHLEEFLKQEDSSSDENDVSLDDMSKLISEVDSLHQSTTLKIQSKIKSLQQIYDTWSMAERLSSHLKSKFENYHETLNPHKKNNELKTYDLIGTRLERTDVPFSDTDLHSITLEVEAFKDKLDVLKLNLDEASCFAHNAFYNSYCLLLDRFRSNLKILNEILSMSKNSPECEQGDVITAGSTEARTDFDLTGLDLNGDDSILDQASFKFDPRLDQLSTPRVNNQKSYSDKSVATIEEKSSQTEGGVDEEKEVLEEARESQAVISEPNEAELANLMKCKSLDSGIICSGSHETNFLSQALESTENESNNLQNLIDYKRIDIRMNTNTKQSLEIEPEMDSKKETLSVHNEKTTQYIEENIHVRKRQNKSASIVKTETPEKPTPSSHRSSWNYLKYFFFIIMSMLVVFMFFVYNYSSLTYSACCDFRRDFVIFNSRVYNKDDGPLPF